MQRIQGEPAAVRKRAIARECACYGAARGAAAGAEEAKFIAEKRKGGEAEVAETETEI